MRKRLPAPPLAIPRMSGPLTEAEQRRVRSLLRTSPGPNVRADLDAVAGASDVVPAYLLTTSRYDAERATAVVLHEMTRTRYADPWDYWRAL